MQILRITAYVAVDNRVRLSITAKNEKGEIIVGSTNYCQTDQADAELNRVRDLMATTQKSVFSTDDAHL